MQFGPMTPRQRQLEKARRSIADIALPLERYFAELARIRFEAMTREQFADLQISADTLAEHIRRGAQDMYDLLEVIAQEPDRMAELERRVKNRFR